MARHNTFTQEEENFLIENYSSMAWDELIDGISRIGNRPRKKQTIISKASHLGLRRSSARNGTITDEEGRLIETVYNSSSEYDLVDNLNTLIASKMPYRTLRSVRTWASKHGLHVRERWTDCDIDFILDNYYTMFTEDIAKALNRTPIAIYNMVRKLGLKGAPRSLYSKEDIEFVRDNYLQMSDEEIGKVLHRAGQSIKELRRKYQIYRRDPCAETNYIDIIRFVQAHNSDWKKRSMEACHYKCVLTGGEFNDIHHLYAKNMIVNNVLDKLGLPYDLNINTCEEKTRDLFLQTFLEEQDKYPLGVCLDGKLHKGFHVLYGFGDNTPEQFYEYAAMFPQNSVAEIIT